MAKKNETAYAVLVDTREQIPWEFPGSRPATLKTGDYTLEGFETSLCVERKRNTGEIAANLTQDRFERELGRMDEFPFSFVVCEFTLADLLAFPRNSGIPPHRWKWVRLTPQFLLKRVMELQLAFKARWVFAGDHGRAYASSLFKRIVELQARSPATCPT
jgi:hypothetical protein